MAKIPRCKIIKKYPRLESLKLHDTSKRDKLEQKRDHVLE